MTPLGTPRVLDEDVVISISDGEDGMVDLDVTIFKDFLGLGVIILPVGGINGDGDWSVLEGSNE